LQDILSWFKNLRAQRDKKGLKARSSTAQGNALGVRENQIV